MKSKELYRIVQPMEDLHLEDQINKALEDEAKKLVIPTKVLLKFRVSRWLHRVGIHHYVRWRVFDARSARFLETGEYVCLFCGSPQR